MDYDQFKVKVLKLFETNSESSARKACHELIPEISFSEEEKQHTADSARAAVRAYPNTTADYWISEMTKRSQELRFGIWMDSLAPEISAIAKRKADAARAAWQAAWNKKTPEEKAAYLEEERKFKEKCHAATAAALDSYYEEAARTGSYSGD